MQGLVALREPYGQWGGERSPELDAKKCNQSSKGPHNLANPDAFSPTVGKKMWTGRAADARSYTLVHDEGTITCTRFFWGKMDKAQ
jgi:hypothetical protein